jgi:UTP--glucose-1-phosphate uridylyltransferase
MRIKKAVIPAAGLGTRFYPITKVIPKEMLPLNNIPMINYVIDEAILAGIEQIAIITRRGKTVIEDYIDTLEGPGYENVDFCYLRQKEPKGFGDAILRAKNFVGNEAFSILVGDELFDPNPTKALINAFDGHSILSVQKNVSNPWKYANVYWTQQDATNRYYVTNLIEKPIESFSTLTSTGRYILTSNIFKYLEKAKPTINNEVQLTDSIRDLLKVEDIYAIEFSGQRYDVGTPEGYINYIKNML